MSIVSVMIIDDNEADRYLLSRLVRKAGITDHVIEASDGKEALILLADRAKMEREHPGRIPPPIIFLDINMPIVNGFEFLEKFGQTRLEQGYESVVLMMFSSSERDEERKRALGFDFVAGFVSKMPKSAEVLRSQVAEATGIDFG